jgi:hypothetical protein
MASALGRKNGNARETKRSKWVLPTASANQDLLRGKWLKACIAPGKK